MISASKRCFRAWRTFNSFVRLSSCPASTVALTASTFRLYSPSAAFADSMVALELVQAWIAAPSRSMSNATVRFAAFACRAESISAAARSIPEINASRSMIAGASMPAASRQPDDPLSDDPPDLLCLLEQDITHQDKPKRISLLANVALHPLSGRLSKCSPGS